MATPKPQAIYNCAIGGIVSQYDPIQGVPYQKISMKQGSNIASLHLTAQELRDVAEKLLQAADDIQMGVADGGSDSPDE